MNLFQALLHLLIVAVNRETFLWLSKQKINRQAKLTSELQHGWCAFCSFVSGRTQDDHLVGNIYSSPNLGDGHQQTGIAGLPVFGSSFQSCHLTVGVKVWCWFSWFPGEYTFFWIHCFQNICLDLNAVQVTLWNDTHTLLQTLLQQWLPLNLGEHRQMATLWNNQQRGVDIYCQIQIQVVGLEYP